MNPPAAPCVELQPADEPALFAALAGRDWQVATITIYADARLQLERTRALASLIGRRRLALQIGVAALAALSLPELQAICSAAVPRATRALLEAQVAWSAYAHSIRQTLAASGHGCRDLFACVAAARAAGPRWLLDERVRRLLGQRPRIVIDAIAGPPALSLLVDEAARALELAWRGPEPLLSIERELDLAAGIALHDDSVELSQLKWPGADSYLLHGVERLQRALGPRHPLLVRPLANAARAWLDGGDGAAAAEALERALSIHRAGPDPDENETIRLERLLARVQEAGAA